MSQFHPSLASADSLNMEAEISALKQGTFKTLHLDIEDTTFTPDITFGSKVVRQLLTKFPTMTYSLHMMVKQASMWLDDLPLPAGSYVFFHAEATEHLHSVLRRYKNKGYRVGITFNPETCTLPFRHLESVVDALMIMTAEPDEQGQVFNPYLLNKVAYTAENFSTCELWVDGNVMPDNLLELKKNGATDFVVGRCVFQSDCYSESLNRLTQIADGAKRVNGNVEEPAYQLAVIKREDHHVTGYTGL